MIFSSGFCIQFQTNPPLEEPRDLGRKAYMLFLGPSSFMGEERLTYSTFFVPGACIRELGITYYRICLIITYLFQGPPFGGQFGVGADGFRCQIASSQGSTC